MKHKKHSPLIAFALSVGLAGAAFVGGSGSVSADATTQAGLRFVSRWTSGSGIGGAEISAFDPASGRLFVTNGKTNQIDIVDISKPVRPRKVRSIDLAAKGATGVQSVATKNGIVAIATSVGGNNQANGKIFLTDTNGKLLKGAESGIEVGALPDHVSFSPSGRYVMSANEGEPSSYCKAADGTLPTTTDPYGSVSLIDVGGVKPSAATTINFESFNDRATSLVFQGGRVFGPGASLAQDLEPEYVTFSEDEKYAYVTMQENNAIATIDIGTKSIVSISGLGFKKHSDAGKGLDAVSDKTALVANQNVQGMYMPDAISTLTAEDGTTYLVTANEGDARAYACLLGGTSTTKIEDEEAKLSAVADSSDSTISAVSKAVGSLGVTPFAPATPRSATVTGSTKVKVAYSFGSRSISIWKATNDVEGVDTMTQVWDSGDQFEQLIAARRPTFFNADWDTTGGAIKAIDARSTKKGPEPEAVVVGKAYGKTWIAAGLERDGGVVLFDATAPTAPVFVDYINTSEPTGNLVTGANAGDVSPEGLLFVSEDESPTGNALVIASFELSGTVAIYEIPSKTPSAPRKVRINATPGKLSIAFRVPVQPGWAGDIAYAVKCTTEDGSVSAKGQKTKLSVSVPTSLRGAKAECVVSSKSTLGKGGAAEPISITLK
jgi:hypothetical protein